MSQRPGRPPIHIIAVGKVKGASAKYLQPGIDAFLDRLQPYASLSIVEVAEETVSPTRTREQILEREADRLLPHFDRAAYRVVLSEHGSLLSSEQFAEALSKRCFSGNPLSGGPSNPASGPTIFVIGGPLGLSPKVVRAADWVVSLSPMTFPHQMVRLLILEQLYRAFRIQRNEPYHK
jgi:23S rRNA (pseudouridine1915-N3)-methyltransferase